MRKKGIFKGILLASKNVASPSATSPSITFLERYYTKYLDCFNILIVLISLSCWTTCYVMLYSTGHEAVVF